MSTDEYTPTTDEMRDVYTWDRCVKHGRDDSLDTRTFRAEFDRWLAARDAEMAERIAQTIEEGRLVGYGSQEYIDGCRHATDRAARIAREGGRA